MPVLVYTLLRLALFAVVTVALWFVGMRSWLAPVAGLFVAWALSYVLLGRQSRAAAAWVEQRATARAGSRRVTASDEDASYEDAAVDAAEARLAEHPEDRAAREPRPAAPPSDDTARVDAQAEAQTEADADPAAPQADEQPAAPQADEQPAAPQVDEQPVERQTDEQPVERQTDEQPVERQTDEQPVGRQTEPRA
ncbi:DUF4229 domain-containing protein [Cellulomonas persica]|uniref:DUF4229 domain-containing protein n=1 Tax=Cellulomonas persica TaxID=76861 RepID=A0A510UWF0_9CELL|nr:DUF4229 domain-containing protein [Cellulomonas persica]GEK18978.1 hypothetical protein CPE01_27110 [Cellulomonas persica]